MKNKKKPTKLNLAKHRNTPASPLLKQNSKIVKNMHSSAFLFFVPKVRLHDGVILQLRPEFFSFFFSYVNLVAPVRFK